MAEDQINKIPDTSRELTGRAFRPWEVRLFGSNSFVGPLRLIALIVILGLVFGVTFAFLA